MNIEELDKLQLTLIDALHKEYKKNSHYRIHLEYAVKSLNDICSLIRGDGKIKFSTKFSTVKYDCDISDFVWPTDDKYVCCNVSTEISDNYIYTNIDWDKEKISPNLYYIGILNVSSTKEFKRLIEIFNEKYASEIKKFKKNIDKKKDAYIKNRDKRNAKYKKEAPQKALTKLTKHLADNNISFTKEELQVVIPILLDRKQDVKILQRWLAMNKKLSQSLTDDLVAKIHDSISVIDILE